MLNDMNVNKPKILNLTLVTILFVTSIYFLLATINTSVRKKYEVFEARESYYYSTLKTESEKQNYIEKIKSNNKFIKIKLYSYFGLTILCFFGVILFLRKILTEKKNVA